MPSRSSTLKTFRCNPCLPLTCPTQAAEMNGHTELHVTLRGPLKDRQHLEAHLDIPVFQVSYEKHPACCRRSHPRRLRERRNHASAVSRSRAPAPICDCREDVPLAGSAPASLNLVGGVDLRLLQILEPDLDSHGQLQFDIRSQGDKFESKRAGPNPHRRCGTAASQPALRLATRQWRAHFANKRLDVTQFQGQLGGRNGDGARRNRIWTENSIRSCGAVANEAQLVYQGLRVTMDGNLALTGTPQAAVLSGRVNVGRISAAPDFDITNFSGAGHRGSGGNRRERASPRT